MSPRFLLLLLAAAVRPCAGLVRLRGSSFLDAPARFGPRVSGDGICGSLRSADPSDACTPIKNSAGSGGRAFVLVVRGNCSFEDKVREAQRAGFNAVVVYDDEEKASLYSMVGDSEGIHIPAVFLSKMAGETLKKFARGEDSECCIESSMDETAGTVLKHVVDKLPCLVYKAPCSSGSTSEDACAICLEDYDNGDMLRLLPCRHEFHTVCVDPWLTKWGTFCPVCKLEVITGE
ncbi:hypothetical protein BRADI_5g04590v3 [Brachypodium distachyon]|uniref:RING-type E3 ubiquitin transferase n=1 Tax=Brachypodium distachyon TaxID=15368 RepID=A0A0Q3E2W2_BRADI|nr:hypothetical protein BRADI_5g04590v3 [Brachypodium distachyon]